MISITTVHIHMQIQRRTLCCSSKNAFINFWLQLFDTRGETQFLKVFRNHTILTTPPTFGTSRGVLDLNSSSLVGTRNGRKLNSMAENSILCPNGRSSIVCQHGPISISPLHGQTSTSQHQGRTPTKSFSKFSKFSAHLFWAWHHLHSSLISCLGFIMTMVIIISFAHERKLHQLGTHLNS